MARTQLFEPLVIWVDDANAEAALLRLQETLSPPSLMLFMNSVVEPHIKDRIRDRFNSEGDDASGKWAPLAEATLAVREAYGFDPGPINVRTGEFREYITGAEGEFKEEEAELGVSWSYPADVGIEEDLYQKLRTAQVGATQSSGQFAGSKTPPRPVLAVSEADQAYIAGSLFEFIVARQAGIIGEAP